MRVFITDIRNVFISPLCLTRSLHSSRSSSSRQSSRRSLDKSVTRNTNTVLLIIIMYTCITYFPSCKCIFMDRMFVSHIRHVESAVSFLHSKTYTFLAYIFTQLPARMQCWERVLVLSTRVQVQVL